MTSKGGRRDIALENDDYMTLDKLSVPLTKENTHEEGSFTLCFWMYLLKSSKPGIVIRQGRAEDSIATPFLTVDGDWRLTLHPLPPPVHNGTIDAAVPADENTIVVSDQSCPMEKWVHLGCEVGANIARLHMDGVVVGERSIVFSSQNKCPEANYGPVLLSGGDGSSSGGNVQAYGHYVCVLPQPSVTNHYVKNPPLELSLDGSTGAADDHELEEGGDGVWSVVGGKASCRRNFALDVVLLDALGRSVHKEMELVASLVYADTGSPVEKPKDDAEAPLLTTFDGVEFPSVERPIKLVHGRASFKLKISQLSSKCDNRLFRVCFDSPAAPKYPFLRVFSRPIRCVSRNRNSRTPAAPWKRSLAAIYPLDATVSPGREETALENMQVSGDVQANGHSNAPFMNGSKLTLTQPPAKQARLGEDRGTSRHVNSGTCLEKAPERMGMSSNLSKGDALVAMVSGLQRNMQPAGTGYPWSAMQQGFSVDPHYVGTTGSSFLGFNKQDSLREGPQYFAGTENEAGNYVLPAASRIRATEGAFPDFLVFKYCLESMHSRATFLKGVVQSRGDQDLVEFAARVSQCTGCHHDGFQISIARKLLEEGNGIWSQVSQDRHSVLWTPLVNVVQDHFMRLSGFTRCFSPKDKEFLRRIARCGEEASRDEFDRLWQWLYPVALTLTLPQVHATWESEDPKWIEGMISREEGEEMLRNIEGLPKPGTFVVRFASSRIWPHPDAGALVVSYVGRDLRINHKLLSLDQHAGRNMDDKSATKPLSELLLMQPELSQLCSMASSEKIIATL
ncbi:hypothetical protein O6H91_05G032600 [Diphasiastrum complanatum]|uniref:Uncharacterized protein n=6 Tax=Diphasiastrum complanatum TaxID=34168 RepID=A0ACC2DM81_DIPCM|nr:hypothetical protein O6H91_05G032600 [Diphasiastrum complanatum]KAJ7555330.1 hypothetical protein O6H91_05G032600 [Diphasiastrum complanatum]KAJ7555331.1 hypothetical protein O6H91_05G032600 [Diphasiastrum complanatum]KAJ7555332.1 hypothetical protein O6H91_05G032600 [Diphasiastrum complanatum]KAJ7555333.1 hypothetical protein O6H91_05G032600 [Diphasiastrum complanatum]